MARRFADWHPYVTSRLRLRDYDYSSTGHYFVTFVTKDRAPILGTVRGSSFDPSPFGESVIEEWRTLPAIWPSIVIDDLQLMPDHVHCIIYLGATPSAEARRPSLSDIIGRWKSLTTRRYWDLRDDGTCENLGTRCWQEGFVDKIVRNHRHYERIEMYMILNPHRMSQKEK